MILYLIRKTLTLTRFDKFGHNSLTPSETYFVNAREVRGEGHSRPQSSAQNLQKGTNL